MSGGTPVLVIGGAGYIGAHVCLRLRESGFLPVVYDNLSTGFRRFVQWGALVEGDTANAAALCEAARSHGAVAAIHLAAFIEVGESVRDPLRFYRNNAANAVEVATALRDGGVRALVFSSTAAIYGEPRFCPIPEDHPQLPVNPYGASKAMAERIFTDSAAAGGVPCLALRYFNACGADPEARVGEAHEPETHLIPRACLAALGRVPPLKVFGTDFDTPDGTALRDYVHVCDLADAHILALRHLLGGGPALPINLGLGRGISVREVIAAVERVSGRKVPHETAPRRQGDAARLYADPSRAQTVLGWQPKFTDLDEIVATAFRWHAAQV
jgi:UDP-arabinose 4-epimerase